MVQSWFKVVVKRRNALIVATWFLNYTDGTPLCNTQLDQKKQLENWKKGFFVTSIKHCRFKAIYIDPYFPNLQKRALFARFYWLSVEIKPEICKVVENLF